MPEPDPTKSGIPDEKIEIFEGPRGFALARSDVVAIFVGVIVAIVLYLEPQKTSTTVVACLLILVLCLAYLLFHWFSHSPWVRNATKNEKRKRFTFVAIVAATMVALYGWHVWPKEDQTQKILEQLKLGQEYESAKLSAQFPIGYVIFKLEYSDRLVFYKGLSLIENYDFNWDAVKYTENKENTFEIQMPNIVTRDGRVTMRGNMWGGQKRVGFFSTYHTMSEFKVICEVLDADKDGIVLLIGLMPSH